MNQPGHRPAPSPLATRAPTTRFAVGQTTHQRAVTVGHQQSNLGPKPMSYRLASAEGTWTNFRPAGNRQRQPLLKSGRIPPRRSGPSLARKLADASPLAPSPCGDGPSSWSSASLSSWESRGRRFAEEIASIDPPGRSDACRLGPANIKAADCTGRPKPVVTRS